MFADSTYSVPRLPGSPSQSRTRSATILFTSPESGPLWMPVALEISASPRGLSAHAHATARRRGVASGDSETLDLSTGTRSIAISTRPSIKSLFLSQILPHCE
jgi:hypothetical protein